MGGTVGYFGKIAAMGDFIRRDLPAGFAEAWDPWLQAGISESRGALGERWLELYQVAPVWRFALGPGLCGPAAVAGILMPSQDRVGRLFPLTIVAILQPDTAEEAIIDEAAMTAMEEAALDTLDPDLGRAAFDDAVGALAPPSGPPGPALRGSLWRAAADGGVLQLRHPAMPPVSYFATFLDLTTARWAMVQA